ncbi:hypothetical protein ENSA7_27350 [Enhygromyxa salina]|uniref:Uncharacterized protein n=1 Tax=Enhygromyxa salina TaxID=215803 RepID=A0A2S9YRM3_9BACT|nr:hypothetical protein ENSA7_27350 [Enhygromyxa salina]
MTTCSSLVETAGLMRLGGSTLTVRTFSSVAKSVSAWNRRWLQRISHSTTPSENTSLRRSIVAPRTCSGDM